MPWLSHYTLSRSEWKSGDVTYQLYEADRDAGKSVTLGSNCEYPESYAGTHGNMMIIRNSPSRESRR